LKNLLSIALVVVSLAVAGCQSSVRPEQGKLSASDKATSEILKDKFIKNGAYLYCDQTGYTNCLNISREQCLTDLAPYPIECLSYAVANTGDSVNLGTGRSYGLYFGECIMAKHIEIISYRNDISEVERVAKCFETMELSKDQFAQSFFK